VICSVILVLGSSVYLVFKGTTSSQPAGTLPQVSFQPSSLPLATLPGPVVYHFDLTPQPTPQTEATPVSKPQNCSGGSCSSVPVTDEQNIQQEQIPAQYKPDPFFDSIQYFINQWQWQKSSGCGEIWGLTPDPQTLPSYLRTPSRPEDLTSSIPYYLLAGMLIRNKAVDASSCPNNGMQSYLIADSCGLQVALPFVQVWQNRFDQAIFQVAQDTNIPGQLLKNIFSRESQFWPGIYTTYQEAGLGQLTVNGADTLLTWNPSFFKQFCTAVMDRSVCNNGYSNMTSDEKDLLRGAVVRLVNATCPNCPNGIGTDQAVFSVRVFAESMLANCQQSGQVVDNITHKPLSEVTSYNDMWLFTLVNYNAGSGCLSAAVKSAWDQNFPLDWVHVSGELPASCSFASIYVDDITLFNMPDQTFPGVNPNSVPTPIPTP
jgi:hypothetical protein